MAEDVRDLVDLARRQCWRSTSAPDPAKDTHRSEVLKLIREIKMEIVPDRACFTAIFEPEIQKEGAGRARSQQAPQDPLLVDRIVADAAVRSYRTKHRKTAVTFGFSLPPTLSGVSAEAARYRAGSLRRYGATIGEFSVPPGIVAHPHVKRLLVVSQNLGNLSSLYSSHANVAGFEIVSPVLGLLFYNAAVAPRNSSAKIIRILVAENPVRVNFSANTMARRSFCAGFELDGNVRITDRTASGVCEDTGAGAFAVVC
ncbi:uncharacterized protein LOC109707837 [Ananas comosus]|uniref:Uncharacterized protein LOC109707837 n=1 Tax=Ananas comosus TaxID=4615 RepID=A0A6P5ENA0_ANACO|nr:uncharacterized protein LOC109707837 [Ananas comosus]